MAWGFLSSNCIIKNRRIVPACSVSRLNRFGPGCVMCINIHVKLKGYFIRTNIVLDDELVEETFALTGVRTKKDLIRLALSELVPTRRKKDLMELAGRIRLRKNFDHKSMSPCRSRKTFFAKSAYYPFAERRRT